MTRLRFSDDPRTAEREMRAIILYLTTFGYIDGELHPTERRFVEGMIAALVRARVEGAGVALEGAAREELVARFTAHFHEVFEETDRRIRDLFDEALVEGEARRDFVLTSLEVRCLEAFQTFDAPSRVALLEALDGLGEADGRVDPAEARFRTQLAALLGDTASPAAAPDAPDAPGRLTLEVGCATRRPPPPDTPRFFDPLERPYSGDPVTMLRQLAEDREILDETLALLDDARARGRGRLDGRRTVDELWDEGPFLDGHVYWCPTRPEPGLDLTVLGDLHGCYSCLKAAVLQARFFEKLARWRAFPDEHPEPRLVFLGDYIDRGRFSLNGVLRTVLRLYCAAPGNVHVLRGNHEHFLEHEGEVYGGVKPSESIDDLRPLVSVEVFRHYRALFEALPTSMLFGRTLFVHGGIPRERTLAERWEGLASLNDPEVRFEMMWSDPSSADVIPAPLQAQSARFAFGRLQAAAFLRRWGGQAIVRGHEKVLEGFRAVYDDPQVRLFTLFSAGGATNADLPEGSSYRDVRPMALTLHATGDTVRLSPWAIAYEGFNRADRNGFFRDPPRADAP